MIKVKIHTLTGARIPTRSTDGAAAYDVSAHLPPDTDLAIEAGSRIAVPTGLYFEIPDGYMISLRPRSGLALKQGITLLNTPATIDSDYRGELMVILANLSYETFVIRNGDRIAQLLVEKVLPFEWERVPRHEIQPSDRGSGGFGSTGIA